MIEDLTPEELAGGWIRLCGALIGHAADALTNKPLPAVSSKSGLEYRMSMSDRRRVAAAWVNGDPAVVPFAEAVEQLGWSEDYARRAFDKYLRSRRKPT